MTPSDETRHRCEVRHVLSMQTKDQRREFFKGVQRTRGPLALDQLQRDVADQWKKGNRGEQGLWL